MGYQDFYGNYDHVLNNLKSAWEELTDTRRQLAEANAKIKYYEKLYEDVDHIIGLEVELAGSREQINTLANFIMEKIPGEPSQSQGAIDTAIRLLGDYHKALRDIMNEIGVPQPGYLAPVANAYEIARQTLDGRRETVTEVREIPTYSSETEGVNHG